MNRHDAKKGRPTLKLKTSLESQANDLFVPPSLEIGTGSTPSRGRFLVSSSDPITGAVDRIGWHAVNVSANDVATSGIMPDSMNIVALFPANSKRDSIGMTLDEIDKTASALGITVVGCSSSITPGLKREMIMATAFGTGDSFVTSASSKVNDSILLTKTAGIEGTSILSRLHAISKLLDPETARRGVALLNQLSILKEASEAFKTGKVHAMHDLTEGGVIGCLLEMSIASGLGFELNRDRVHLDGSTISICDELGIDPLKLIGSGSLLIACNAADVELIVNRLKDEKILCTEIGKFLPRKQGRWITNREKKEKLNEISVQDELWPTLRKYSNLP